MNTRDIPTDKAGASSFIYKSIHHLMTTSVLHHIRRFYYSCSTYWRSSPTVAEATFPVSQGNNSISYNIFWIYNNYLPVKIFLSPCSCSLPSQAYYCYIPLFSAMWVSQRLFLSYQKYLSKFIPPINRGTSFDGELKV